MYLHAKDLYLQYGQRPLLRGCSLYIGQGDKIGLIGQNGTGKSSLLRILAGLEPPDSGHIDRAGGVRIAYLAQDTRIPPEHTVLSYVLSAIEPGQREQKAYEAKSILNRLGLSQHDAPAGRLSGGQQKRAAIAAALVAPSELLILDEPTNHLDTDMVTWLESYLAGYRGAVLMVTHDRYFLDRVVGQIAELDRGQLHLYPGSYSAYVQGWAERQEMAAASERKRQSILKKELAWLQRGARARGTKSRGRIERYQQLSEREAPAAEGQVAFSSLSSRLGRKTLAAEHLRKQYGQQVLVDDFSYLMPRDDRVGIIGPNGCGKTTLLGMLAGDILPDSGSVDVGQTVKLGYFRQTCDELDQTQRAIDYIREIAENVQTADGTLTASQMMERFLFDGDMQHTEIGRLSGGEQRRLYLLGILMQAPNVLFLDEPTNDLDIQTLTILEDYLDSFSGAVVTVSHDRYFLDRVAQRIFCFEGQGQVRQYLGGYTDYLQKRPQTQAATAAPKESRAAPRPKKERPLRFSFKEEREFAGIDGDIAALEETLSELEGQIEKAARDFAKLQELLDQKEALQAQLDEKMERWVYLNDLNDRITAQKGQ